MRLPSDPAHVLFAHHGVLGKRDSAIPFNVKLKVRATLILTMPEQSREGQGRAALS